MTGANTPAPAPSDLRAFLKRNQASLAVLMISFFVIGVGLAAQQAREVEHEILHFDPVGRLVSRTGEQPLWAAARTTHIAIGIDDTARLRGFIHGHNLAPGDVVGGHLRLDSSAGASDRHYELVLRVSGALDVPTGAVRLDDHLLLERLSYGGVDFINDGRGDLVPEIDRVSDVGNSDGKASLRELTASSIRLPPPAARAEGGTALVLEFVLDAELRGDGRQFAGQALDLTFSFTLGPRSDADLTPPRALVTNVVEGSSARVVFTFSKSMDRASVHSALSGAAAWNRSWNPNSTVLTLVAPDLSPGIHTLTLSRAAHDVYGIGLSAPATQSITIASPPPRVLPPGPPVALTAIAGDATVSLTWSPPSSDGGANVTRYHVLQGTSSTSLAPVASVAGTSHTVQGLRNETTYFFQVAAENSAGIGTPSNMAQATPYGPVTVRFTVTPPQPDGLDGWYVTAPSVAFNASPAGSTVHYRLDGGEEAIAAGAVEIPNGTRTLFYRASHPDAGASPTQQTTLRFDPSPPEAAAVNLSAASVLVNESIRVRAELRDWDSGVARAVAVMKGPSGAVTERTMTFAGGSHAALFPLSAVGNYTIDLIAYDRAGHVFTAYVGQVSVQAPKILAQDEIPLEEDADVAAAIQDSWARAPAGSSTSSPPSSSSSSSTSGSTQPPPEDREQESRREPEPPRPRLEILRSDNSAAGATDGVSGNVVIRVENVQRAERTRIVVIAPDGTETVLTRGAKETEWNTTAHESGYYRVETREERDDGSEVTIASTTVLVQHPRATPVQAAAAMATGVAVAVTASVASSAAASGGASAAASAAGGRAFDLIAYLREALGAVGEDKLRDRTKTLGAGKRRFMQAGGVVAATVALVLVALFFTFEGIEGLNARDYLATLPLVGFAAAVFFSMAWGAEILLARASGAVTKFRLLVSGAIALAFSSILFRQAFGYAGFVEKDEIGDDAELPQRRLAALRVLAVYGFVLATSLPFLLVGFLWRYDFTEWGLTIALTALATSSMPVKPLPGSEVWRWSRALAIVTTALAFVLYFAFEVGWISPMHLATFGVFGGIGYAVAWWRLSLVSGELTRNLTRDEGEEPRRVDGTGTAANVAEAATAVTKEEPQRPVADDELESRRTP